MDNKIITKRELMLEAIANNSQTLNKSIIEVIFKNYTNRQLTCQLTKEQKVSILKTHFNANFEKAITQITYKAIKVHARGQYNQNSDTFSLSSYKATQLLSDIYNFVWDDLKQEVALYIYQHYKAGNIILIDKIFNSKHYIGIKASKKGNIANIRQIYNAVQNFLYQHIQKHINKLYTISDIKEDKEGNIIEELELYTKAQRNYDLSINNLHFDYLMDELKVKLTGIQINILDLKLNSTKIVKHVQQKTVNNKAVYETIEKSVPLTNSDIADKLQVHEKTILYNLNIMREKISNFISIDKHAKYKTLKIQANTSLSKNAVLPDICKGIIDYTSAQEIKLNTAIQCNNTDEYNAYTNWLFVHSK